MKLTVTGLKTGTTDINASERGVYKGWVFQVDVKPRKEIGVRVFSATDAERGPGSLLRFMPTQATLQAVSDKILPQQANVTFKVEDGGSFSADFDLDSDGRLLCERAPSSTGEIAALRNSFRSTYSASQDRIDVLYVYELSVPILNREKTSEVVESLAVMIIRLSWQQTGRKERFHCLGKR